MDLDENLLHQDGQQQQHQQHLGVGLPSSYLPDLLPVQAQDLLQQNLASNHHEFSTTPPPPPTGPPLSRHDEVLQGSFTHHNMSYGTTVLETLQPIRKEEIVRLRNDGGSVTIVETQLIGTKINSFHFTDFFVKLLFM